MKRTQRAIALCCCFFLAAYLGINDARAQEHFRVKRPTSGDDTSALVTRDNTQTQTETQAQIQAPIQAQIQAPTQAQAQRQNPSETQNQTAMPTLPESSAVRTPLHAIATMDQEMLTAAQPTQSFYNSVVRWESKNSPNLQSMSGTAGSAHHGLKAHLGGAFHAIRSVAGTVASAYVPITVPKQPDQAYAVLRVNAGHCPAMVDPAFQIPVRWWDDLAREQGDPYFGPQWSLWLKAVKDVFESRASELKYTPGSAALHVIVNPNGSIFNMSPYTGPERTNGDKPPSESTLLQLRDMVGIVGVFPPFPVGTKVRCYHLIFDGSSGI
ncbi:MAG TPA: hypothetical protein V6C89_20370 [Drouetiella sp.]|jgi:hypothetical protein